MDKFVPYHGNDRLFTSEAPVGDLLFVLPTPVAADSISLADAWSSQIFAGTFVYAARRLGVTEETANAFVDAVQARVLASGVKRAFIWADPGIETGPLMGLNQTAGSTLTPLVVHLATGLRFTISVSAALSLTGSAVQITAAQLGYVGDYAPAATGAVPIAQLQLDGVQVGTIAYAATFTGASLRDTSSWGLQFACPAASGVTAEWVPFAAGPAGDVGFAVRIDPSSPLNAGGTPVRSRMDFDGQTGKIALASSYRTALGAPVALIPKTSGTDHLAALVFDRGGMPGRPVLLAPAGDFELSTDGGPDPADLLCGLQGTETITFRPRRASEGDRLRFTPYQPAYAPRYPFAVASPVSPQVDPAAPLLDATYTTSWATVISGTGKSTYVAQPKGAPLYGRGDSTQQARGVLVWTGPVVALPPGAPLPLAGYGTAPEGWTATQAADFERQVLGPARRQIIGAQPEPEPQPQPLGHPEPLSAPAAAPYTATTPSGQIVSITDGRWTAITLGRTTNPQLALCFTDPDPVLQQAFQTAGLFLVAANGAYLGEQHEGDGKSGGVPTFNNTVDIGGWRLAANVGTGNEYGDYHNVMIVKGRRGKLYDLVKPADSLIANPDSWTQPDFAIPTEPGRDGSFSPRQRRELVVLSQWLQDYFAAARTGGADFSRFNAIAADPNWTGTLFLRVDVTKVPDDLVGIMAGVADPAGFAAHHLGVEVTPVTGSGAAEPTTTGSSSMFGLIDYTDPAFTRLPAGLPAKPVRPAAGTTYDFRLLTLAVSFANTAVRRFASLAQLTATTWFDMPVDHMGEAGNRFCALILTGTLQTNDGLPVYSLASTGDAQFYLGNDIVRKIEITSAVMSTRSTGDASAGDQQDELAQSWFGLSGFLDFEIVRGRDPAEPDEKDSPPIPLDLFSFGSPVGQDQPRHGLAFANLGILMAFPPDDPADRTFTFEAGEIQFDLATSTPRDGSLFRQFALDIRGLISGGVLTPPGRSGYLAVTTDARLTGVERGPWWGVEYTLSMGSAGHLAGQAGLNAQLLTAWSPRKPRLRAANRTDADTYQAGIGLKLPGTGGGAKLISLQSVLRLSIGQLWLRYDTASSAFMLLLSEIALKVLGLGALPPGSTLFYLYGDPEGGDSASGLGWYAMYRREGIGRPDGNGRRVGNGRRARIGGREGIGR